MPISSSAYKSAIEAIGFPETASDAQSKWEKAWKDCVSGCTQAIKTGSSYSLSGAFEPTDDKSKFFTKLETAGKADIAAFSLIVKYGTTTPPTASISPTSLSDTVSAPAGTLASSVADFAKSAGYTGTPPPPPPGEPPGKLS